MTAKKLYTVRMNTLLIALPVKGFLWTILLFLICFIGTHVIILARFGWEFQQQNTPAKPEKTEEKIEEKKTPPEKQAEPIYYIVERKTRRAKPAYGEPKQINFKGPN